MSFSQEIKDNLCRRVLDRRGQELELATALLLNARFYPNEITLASSHAGFTTRLIQDFKEILGLTVGLNQGRELYTIRIEDRDHSSMLSRYLTDKLSFDTFHGRFDAKGPELTDTDTVVILSSMYLAAGSVSEPRRAYHLELACRRLQVAEFCLGLLDRNEINAALLKRYGNNVVYLKDGQQISDFLGLIGAHASLLNFEALRVEKEMRNTVNRMVNCDTANAQRIANTAARQIEGLAWYDREIGLKKLPADLRNAARARMNNPGLSLAELANLMEPPIGKSGLNHRLQKLEKLIGEARGEREEA